MQPDVSETDSLLKLWAWILANQKRLLMAAAGIAIIALILFLISNYQESKEITASEALSNVQPPRLKDAPPPGEMAKAYLKIIQDYPGSRAAVQATLRAATALFEDGKYAEAQAQFENFLRLDPGSSFAAQAAYGVAVCLDAAGKTTEAAAKYDEVAKLYSKDGISEEAKLGLASVYIAQGKPEMAYKQLEEILQGVQGSRGSAVGQEAFMKQQELVQQFPYLRSNTPAIKPVTTTAPAVINTASNAVRQAVTKATNAAAGAIAKPAAPKP